MPATIFASLVSGIALGAFGSSELGYVAVLIVSEIAVLSGGRLTKQEIFVIWSLAQIAGGSTLALYLIQQLYFRSLATVTWAFSAPDTGIPLPLAIPDWYAPPPVSPVLIERTFFYPDWIIPSFILGTVLFVSWRIADPFMGFICYQLYSVEEKLPFPAQVVAAETCIALAEREKRKITLLMVASAFSAVYATVLYFVPFTTEFRITILPIPWLDLNRSVELVLPGASLGIGTDVFAFASGLILPLNIVVSIFLGSFVAYFIGNHILFRYHLFPDWRPGMDVTWAFQRSILSFWAFPQIGLALAGALVPFILKSGILIRAFKSLMRIPAMLRETGILPLKIILPAYFGAYTIPFAIFAWFTKFPWYLIALLIFGWGFLASILAGRALAVSGMWMTIPYVNETVLLASGYKGVDIWFMPFGQVVTGGGGWCAGWYKVCDLTKTSFTSWIKAYILVTPIAWIFSYVYMGLFWKMSPIPSSMYPAVSIFWPVSVINRSLWITGQVGVGLASQLIIGSFALGGILHVACTFLNIPFSLISSVLGLMTPLPTCITVLVGGIVGKMIAWRRGAEWWTDSRPVIAGGIYLGGAVVLTLSVALVMVLKSMWTLPF